MGAIVNLVAKVTGLWKKMDSVLSLVGGVGMVLSGAGSIALDLSHSANAAALLKAVEGLSAQDPRVVMLVGGLSLLGLHSAHADTAAAVAAPQAQAAPSVPPVVPPQA